MKIQEPLSKSIRLVITVFTDQQKEPSKAIKVPILRADLSNPRQIIIPVIPKTKDTIFQ